jgi:hypothetical protein
MKVSRTSHVRGHRGLDHERALSALTPCLLSRRVPCAACRTLCDA